MLLENGSVLRVYVWLVALLNQEDKFDICKLCGGDCRLFVGFQMDYGVKDAEESSAESANLHYYVSLYRAIIELRKMTGASNQQA